MKKPARFSHKYIVANKADELWGLFVTSVGFQSISPNSDYPPKEHPSAYWFNPLSGRILNEYQIIYITKGEGIFQSASCGKTKVTAGNIILLFPFEWHKYTPARKTGWDEYWIGCNGQNIDKLLKNHFFSKEQPVLDVGFSEHIINLYKQAIDIASYQRIAFQHMLAGLAQLLLADIFYTDRNNSFRDKDMVVKIDKARMIIRENAFTMQKPEEIALQLSMSYSWFRRVFKQYTGLSPVQYQLEIKIQKAKELLTSTTMPIKEIAYELNFESLSYFVSFFKKKQKVSPNQYRTQVHSSPQNQYRKQR